ncbi:MAG TPA: hypothetical protein P5509_09880, partial [Bacteroidales bacterium]|nr:hypothetical protein [Bacteroidales bacterium]
TLKKSKINKTRKLIIGRVNANKQFNKQNRNYCKKFSFYEKTCISITKYITALGFWTDYRCDVCKKGQLNIDKK